uniref:Uncharacterized protein n=1 Tax=Cacopsylla melanoneura TaxID=428564 RepID=A0A8D9E1H0_9HEMI
MDASFDQQDSVPSEADDSDLDKDYVPETDIDDEEEDYTDEKGQTDFTYLDLDKVYVPETDISDEEEDYRDEKEQTDFNLGQPNSPKKNKRKGKIVKRGSNFCIFCESNVLNFGRHILRNHKYEHEVVKINSLPKKSIQRKQMMTALRKKGNFIFNESEGTTEKVVRKSEICTNTDYKMCPKCFGYYSKKQLWRHKKHCNSFNPENASLLNNKSKVDSHLREKVFPHMRCDEVSIVAQKDSLICGYGARYLRIHREKHHIHIVSRKMRELARILIEAKKKNGEIVSMANLLQPDHYDLIVESTKVVAAYDEKTDEYKSPTFAMNIVKSLKDACDVFITQVLKKKKHFGTVQYASMEADIKTLLHLLTTNWQYDISSVAASNLNTKKWNKVTMIPLATDLKIFKDYMTKKGRSSVENLERDPHDKKSYTDLVEVIYCKVLLLNRKRPGELQRLQLHMYNKAEIQTNYEEFSDTVSPTEKILMKKFKRLVIRGKRDRGVPVLFSDDVQKEIDVALKYRDNFFQDVENNYLFGLPGYSSPMIGYKILAKHANKSGAKNPSAITATKLRKHLATITQVLNMSDSDIEQLATFMGHTERVHRNEYRLPDDVFQTARICKLLSIMEKGQGAQYKGKTLAEIELNMEEDLLEEAEKEAVDDENFEEDLYPVEVDGDDGPSTSASSERVHPKKKTKVTRVPWTEEQKSKTMSFFRKHIQNKKPPKRNECETLIKTYPQVFHNKDWLKLKVFVQNKYSK